MTKLSHEQLNQILDDLAPLGGVEARPYFGGTAFALDNRQFAMHLGDEFYFRVDDQTRQQFIDHGSEPFGYDTRNGERTVRAYYQAPGSVLDDPALFLLWAIDAVACARR